MAQRLHLRRTRSASAAPRRHRRLGTTTAALCVAASVVLAVAACSGGCSSDSAAGGGSDGAVSGGSVASDEVAEAEVGPDSGLGDRKQTEARRASRVAPLSRQVIRTGEATLQADDVSALRDEVDRLVQRYGGYVSSERSFTDDEGRLVEDRLVLRVPSARYDTVMAGFEEVATVLAPSTKTEDVTTEVIDVDSRVRTAEVSLERLRKFLSRTTDVNALVRLESEMAEREADLASLRAQQDYLEDQTSLATISVTLQRPFEDEPDDDSAGGFLAGLRGGFDALTGVLVVTATILGALVPFAVVAAVFGVPVFLLVRAAARRRRALAPTQATVSQGMPAD